MDVLTGPFRRLGCRIRGHRPVPGSAWQGSMACGRCGRGVRVSCSCNRARPSERDLTGHRPGCVNHPPEGWPHYDNLTGPQRVRAKLREQGLASTGGDSPEWRLPLDTDRWAEQRPAPARQLVRTQNGELWLLDAEGRVNRWVTAEEFASWHLYEEPQGVVGHAEPEELGGPEIELVLPTRYRGIPYSLRPVSWAEFVRLGGPPPGPPNPPRAPKDRPYA